jgi:hypothetical protein
MKNINDRTAFTYLANLHSNTVSFTDNWLQNPFSSTPDKTINFMTVGDVSYLQSKFGFNVAVKFVLHKTQYQGSRVVYNLFALLSDIGGFVGSI